MAAAAWTAWCTSLGMNQEAVDYLRDDVGIDGPAALRTNVSPGEFGSFLKGLTKQVAAFTPVGNAAKPRVPWRATKGLHAMRLYTEYRHACGMRVSDADVVAGFTNGTNQADWLEHLAVVKQLDSESPSDDDVVSVPKLRSLHKWEPFKELVHTKLKTQRNPVLGHRLTYLLRDYETSTNDHLAATYPSLEERIEATVDLRGPLYKKDNTWLYSFLKGLVVEGDVWTYIQALDNSSDGRAAWNAIKSQAEGPAAKKLRISQGRDKLHNAKFNGKSKKYSFKDYIRTHIKAHDMITRDTKEQLTESTKVDVFLDGISDPLLTAAVAAVKASDTKMATFTTASQHVLQEWLKIKAKMANNQDYSVADVKTKSPPKKKKKGDGNDKPKSGKGSLQSRLAKAIQDAKAGKFKYAANDVWNHKDFEPYRSKILAQRAAKKGSDSTPSEIKELLQEQARTIKTLTTALGVKIGAVRSADEDAIPNGTNEDEDEEKIPEEQDTTATGTVDTVDEFEQAKAASASSQFGRKGRGKVNKKRKSTGDAATLSIEALTTEPIPKKKKKNRALLTQVSHVPGLSSQDATDNATDDVSVDSTGRPKIGRNWRARMIYDCLPKIEYHEKLRAMVLGPDKPHFDDEDEEYLAYGSTYKALEYSKDEKSLEPTEVRRLKWLRQKFRALKNTASQGDDRESYGLFTLWLAGEEQFTLEYAKKLQRDSLKIYDHVIAELEKDGDKETFTLPTTLEAMLGEHDMAFTKLGAVMDNETKGRDPEKVPMDEISDEGGSDSDSDEENEF